MNAWRSVCGPIFLTSPALRATRRTIRPAACRSSRWPDSAYQILPDYGHMTESPQDAEMDEQIALSAATGHSSDADERPTTSTVDRTLAGLCARA
jgi:hypothetical protein